MIESFLLYKKNKNCSESTIKMYKSYLEIFNKEVKKNFKEVKEKDVFKFLSRYSTAKARNGRSVVLKQFYRFIFKLDKDDKLPECVRRVEYSIDKNDHVKYRERVITRQEYNKMILCCKNPMQKAMLETMYNFGVRKSEMLSMKLKDVKFNGENTKITVRESKTQTRDVICEGRSKYLLEWVETLFPFMDEKEHYIFYSSVENDKPYTKENINCIVEMVRKNAGIKRRITPHDFRHTSITNARRKGVPEAFIETNHGLEHGSKQIKTYDHNKLRDYEEWLKKRAEEIKPTYEELENKYKKEINKLEKMIMSLGVVEKEGNIYRYDDELEVYLPLRTTTLEERNYCLDKDLNKIKTDKFYKINEDGFEEVSEKEFNNSM